MFSATWHSAILLICYNNNIIKIIVLGKIIPIIIRMYRNITISQSFKLKIYL